MSQTEIAIRASRLSKCLGGRFVLRDVCFDIAPGQCVALTGANGAGKTTLLRCLATVMRPTSGEVRWFGSPAAAGPAARRLVGVLWHESAVYPHLSIRENLMFAARMYGVDNPADRVERLLRETALLAHGRRFGRAISRGMRQRLAVARAVVHDPRILLLDEPFAGLDRDGAEWLVELLSDLRRRHVAVCFATHDEEKVQRLADRVFALQAARLRDETPGTASAQPEPRTASRAA